jgi:hypothetical protein
MDVAGELDAAALAQRALVAALVLGVVGRTARDVRHARVLVGALEKLAAAEPAGFDLVVVRDGGVVAETGLPSALTAVRRVLGDGAAVALVVGSPVTCSFVQDARNLATASPHPARDDAFALARRWATPRAAASLAPPLDHDRFARFLDAAAAAGLTLVEADVAGVAPGLARVRGIKTSRARALLTTLAIGSAARALLFVPAVRAPKGGLARAKVERLADAWVSAGAARDTAHSSALVGAALAILAERASAGHEPIAGGALLRDARERWTSMARESGTRATPSAKDATDLASALYRLAADERVELYAVDPQNPTWNLTIAR